MYKKAEKLRMVYKSLKQGKTMPQIYLEAGMNPITLWRWSKENKKLAERLHQYKVDALENALQQSALGGFIVKTKEKFNAAGKITERTTTTAAPNVIAIIFSLSNLKSDVWKNNRDKFMPDNDNRLRKSDYQILTEEEHIEADKLLKDFQS